MTTTENTSFTHRRNGQLIDEAVATSPDQHVMVATIKVGFSPSSLVAQVRHKAASMGLDLGEDMLEELRKFTDESFGSDAGTEAFADTLEEVLLDPKFNAGILQLGGIPKSVEVASYNVPNVVAAIKDDATLAQAAADMIVGAAS